MASVRLLAMVTASVACVMTAVYLAYSATATPYSTTTSQKTYRDLSPPHFDHLQLASKNGSWNATGTHQFITFTNPDWDGKAISQCHLSSVKSVDMRNPDIDSCANDEMKIGYVADPVDDDEPLNYGTAICCPTTAYPRWCTWRGGEHQDNNFCNGQCWEGEMTLFSSQYGGTSLSSELDVPLGKCVKGGEKVFCCRSDYYTSLINEGCFNSECGRSCPSGHDTLGPWWDENCVEYIGDNEVIQQRRKCCPSPSKLRNCRWSGHGKRCEDSECKPEEVEVVRSMRGDLEKPCPEGSSRAICCTIEDDPPFLPVDRVKLWPDIPPDTYNINFDIKNLKEIGPHTETAVPDRVGGFGWIIVAGPPELFAVAKQKRDGSPSSLEFLNCHEALGEHRQSVRFVCTSQDSFADCDHLTDHGLEGKVIEMPESCGAGRYAVAHRINVSSDQSLPDHLSHITNKTVLDLTFDYNFGLMKRDAGELMFRTDFDNVGGEHGEWKTIVASDPILQRDLLDKRYWAPTTRPWSEKFLNFLDTASQSKQVTYMTQDYDKILLHNSTDCLGGGQAYADIRANGTIQGKVQVWTMMLGALVPVARIDQANVFAKSELDASMQLNVSMAGNLSTEWMVAELFPQVQLDGFYHPGLISIQPTLTATVDLKVDANMDANYTTFTRVFTKKEHEFVQSWPIDFHGPSGESDYAAPEDAFLAAVRTIREDSIIQVDLKASIGLRITLTATDGLNGLKRGVPYGGQNFDFLIGGSVIGTNAFRAQAASGEFNNTLLLQPAQGDIVARDGGQTIERLDSGPGPVYILGNTTARALGYSYWLPSEAVAAYGKIRPWPITGPFDKTLFQPQSLTCDVFNSPDKLTCDLDLCSLEPGLCFAEDDCGDEEEQDPDNRLRSRGEERLCTANFGRNGEATWWSRSYPEPPALFREVNNWYIYPMAFDYADVDDCFNLDLARVDIPPEQWRNPTTPGMDSVPGVGEKSGYNVEHIIEIQSIPRFVEFAVSGIFPRSKARAPSDFVPIPARWFKTTWRNPGSMVTGNNQGVNGRPYPPLVYGIEWDGSIGEPQEVTCIPARRVMEALGSRPSRDDFVLLRGDLNGLKGKLWQFYRPFTIPQFRKAARAWLAGQGSSEWMLTKLRSVALVYKYLTNDNVVYRWYGQYRNIRAQLQLIETYFPEVQGKLVYAWDLFIFDHMKELFNHGRTWMLDGLDEMDRQIQAAQNSGAAAPPELGATRTAMTNLRNFANTIPSSMPPEPSPSPAP